MASERIQRQIDRLLDEAGEALAQGDWATVRVCAHKVQVIDPENTDVQPFLAAAGRGLSSGGPSGSPIAVPAPI